MPRRNKPSDIHGWLAIDKPLGMSSAAVVAIVRRVFGGIKVGHGGTLDPLASGILPIALGEATKTVAYVMDAQKTYEFTAKWGEQTSTDDAEGEVIATSDIRPDADAITAILPQFTGQISQIPPAYSAIKIDGKRAYDLARQGADEIVLAARDIMIHRLALTAHTNEDACFVTSCGKGTYIRSLARDIATALGTVAHVSHLRRTAVGQFTQENAISLDSLQELGHSAAASPYVIPVVTALDDIPALPITTVEAQKLRFGQRLPPRPALSKTHLYKALCDGTLVALVEATEEGVKSVRVFNC